MNPSADETRLCFDDSVVSIPRERRLRRIVLELSSRCNLDCPMCFLKSSPEARGDMEWDLAESLFDQAEGFPNMEWVHFAGVGEPLVHPKAVEAIGLACGKEECPVPEIRAAIVLTTSNLEKVLEMPKFLREAGVRGVSLSNLVPTSEAMRPLALYPVSLEEEARLQRSLFLAFQKEGLNAALPRFALSSERHCAFARSETAVVRWDGKVSPCTRLSHTYDEWVLGRRKLVCAHSFGSLASERLDAIWDGPAYTGFRWRLRRALYASCLDCNLLPVCEYPKTTESDCWGDSPACSDCLWDRNLIRCP